MSCRVLQFARFVTVQQEYGFPDTRDSLFLGLDLKLAQNFVLLIYPLTKSRTSFNFFGLKFFLHPNHNVHMSDVRLMMSKKSKKRHVKDNKQQPLFFSSRRLSYSIIIPATFICNNQQSILSHEILCRLACSCRRVDAVGTSILSL